VIAGDEHLKTHTGTVKTGINGPCARTLELPLLVRPGVFFFLFVSESRFFAVFFAPFPEEEILDYIAHGPLIRVFTVTQTSIHITRILYVDICLAPRCASSL
jgi:hypothetical protein